jgi:hypothetical protein
LLVLKSLPLGTLENHNFEQVEKCIANALNARHKVLVLTRKTKSNHEALLEIKMKSLLLREHYNDASRADINVVSIWRTKVLFYTFASWKTAGKLGANLRRQAFKLHASQRRIFIAGSCRDLCDSGYFRRQKAHARIARHIRNSWSRIAICDALKDWIDAYNQAGVRSSSGEEEDEEA